MAFRLLACNENDQNSKAKTPIGTDDATPYGVGCVYVFVGAWSYLVAVGMTHVS